MKLKRVLFVIRTLAFVVSFCLLLSSCQKDAEVVLSNEDILPVRFTAGYSEVNEQGPRIRSIGVPSSGKPYMDYVSADGFECRAFFPLGSINTKPRTRTAINTENGTTEWATTDNVGIFMTEQGNSFAEHASNAKYKVTPKESNKTQADLTLDALEPIYYPRQNKTLDLVAYYPWRETPGTNPLIYKLDVSDQTKPATIDLLYAKIAGQAKSTDAVNLEFKHALSKVIIQINTTDGVITPSNISNLTSVSFNLPNEADFALETGTFSNVEIVTAITPQVSTDKKSYSAIVIPGNQNNRTITFVFNATTYTWDIPTTTSFLSGKSHTFTVTLKDKVVVTTEEITDWTSNDKGSVAPYIEAVKIPGKEYYMGKYEVTFAQYDAFCEATSRSNKPSDEGWGRDNRPVINVSAYDAEAFCVWMSDQTGITCRLPDEDEWEHAANGGESFDYSGSDVLSEVGWYKDNSGYQTHPVGEKKANGYGLYDMSGNVWEWTSIWLGSRVLRGGSWGGNAEFCRSAWRHIIYSADGNYSIGFRVVFVL